MAALAGRCVGGHLIGDSEWSSSQLAELEAARRFADRDLGYDDVSVDLGAGTVRFGG